MVQDIFQSIVLATIQGFAEVFPISSSGHLAVYGKTIGQELSYAKVVFFHLGTFLAILYFYRNDVIGILTGKLGKGTRYLMLISFATTVLVGFVVKGTLASFVVQHSEYVAALWLVNGVIVALIGILSKPGVKRIADLQVKEYVIIGVAQGVAALPGISRLGLTLGAGLFQKMTWFEALKLSFLLSLPTILAANLLELFQFLDIRLIDILSLIGGDPKTFKMATNSLELPQVLPSVLIVLTTLSCGLVALKLLYRFLNRRLLIYFGLYCMVAGTFFVLFLSFL